MANTILSHCEIKTSEDSRMSELVMSGVHLFMQTRRVASVILKDGFIFYVFIFLNIIPNHTNMSLCNCCIVSCYCYIIASCSFIMTHCLAASCHVAIMSYCVAAVLCHVTTMSCSCCITSLYHGT